jgi:hypothetical protein
MFLASAKGFCDTKWKNTALGFLKTSSPLTHRTKFSGVWV